MKTNKVITEEEVQKALQKFIKEGGLIKKLPDSPPYKFHPLQTALYYERCPICGQRPQSWWLQHILWPPEIFHFSGGLPH